MRFKHLAAVVFGLLSIIAATAWGTAQVLTVEPVPPKVMTGTDIGFRVVGIRGGRTPIGTLVVKVNGEWVEAETTPPATQPLRP